MRVCTYMCVNVCVNVNVCKSPVAGTLPIDHSYNTSIPLFGKLNRYKIRLQSNSLRLRATQKVNTILASPLTPLSQTHPTMGHSDRPGVVAIHACYRSNKSTALHGQIHEQRVGQIDGQIG